MKRLTTGVLAGTAAAALAAALVQQPATAAMSANAPSQADRPSAAQHRPDNRPGPLTERQNELRRAALDALADGKVTKQPQARGGTVVKLGNGKAVEFFDNKKQANVLSILSEFGDTVVGRYGGTAGPKKGQIPQPDRTKDNSTTWWDTTTTKHYEEMFNGSGESMKSYYRDISGGQFDVTNTVEDWVTVPNNGAYYGANPREDEGGAWAFIDDTGDAWYKRQLAAGKTAAQIDGYLAQFDRWDRYDWDGDMNFDEPDGYIDHFQAIHAGEGEEAGAPADAIWSHRWYVYTGYGSTGPSVAGTVNKLGGAQIGDSKYFIGDYTVEPENGGLGVFAHEFGHDLGLPDFYDTAGGENGTAFWTLMSSGSWLGHGAKANEGIGTTPGGMGPEERLFLGWLNYAEINPGQSGSYTLNPAGQVTPTSGTHAVKVNLTDKKTTTAYTTPPEGSNAWWSGRGNLMENTLTREVPKAARVTVTASAWYQIEQNYDYLYGEYSLDGGKTWKSAGNPLTGDSRGWKSVRFSYAPNAASQFRLRYKTDDYVNEAGAFIDNIAIAGDRTYSFSDGAEQGVNGWTADGWKISTGTETALTPRYYLLENRSYVGYDTTLGQGPYNFSEAYTRPNWVEFFSFQDGMLVWYVDWSFLEDNNTSQHPGEGYALPVDARPAPFTFPDGTRPSNRRQPFDATFGRSSEGVCLHKQVPGGTKQAPTVETLAACVPASGSIATFDDSNPLRYWSSANPQNSVKVAGVGVTATVTKDNGRDLVVTVTNPAK